MWSKFDSCISINVDQHKLVNKVLLEIGKISEMWGEFCKISNSNLMFGSQAVRFNKNFGFLKPCKKVVLRAMEFNTTKSMVA